MKAAIWICFFSSFLFFFFTACKGKVSNEPSDTYEQGTIHISVDESFKPMIDAQIRVYENSYPQTKIIAHYKPEAECLRDFAVDSIRLVIATRGYTQSEALFLQDSMKVAPSKMVVAYDAVAVILPPQSADTLFTMQEIKDLLTGRLKKNLTPVFDGVTATSTVRFIVDSVLRGDTLSSRVVAARSSEGVIDYVAKTPNTVGFIGVSWIGNPDDSTHLTYLQKVRVAQIEHPLVPGIYVTPAQYNIYFRRYPMVRDLVYTLKEKHRGLGHGFANFLTTQRGQLIFNRAYLMPALMTFDIRGATLRE
ncbi:MAG: substrate-binding domain-containing protein [Bacteroidota bacterium]|nr:substrate-binding domain-containing protein [Flavisolibacter sp.]MBD0352537.1 substrate-binding domain-containing protein [Flavisolibacter sp.]MBD0375270.1 substrate-binding domain-containing protein [Flavisolibacter sp.]MDQ3843220.1 substrate-binding domain-containing protein [Bacteroidota bacterium]